MKRTIILLTLMLSTLSAFGQKVYVWAPNSGQPPHRPLFEQTDTVDVVVFDGRNIPSSSKVECTSEELVSIILDDIQKIYSGATFNILDNAKYYKPSSDNHITIKIGIGAYHAGFGADVDVAIGNVGGNFAYSVSAKGKWNAVTSFYLRIFDKRGGEEKDFAKEILSQDGKPNTGGYTTAKKVLSTTYMNAFSQLCTAIDSFFME